MKKTASFLSKTAYLIATLILGWLSYNTAHYTYTHDFDDFSAIFLYECPDSRFKNLMVLFFVVIFSFLFSKLLFLYAKTKKQKDFRVLVFSIVLSLIFLVAGCIWTSRSYIEPFWDQAEIIKMAYQFINKDYSFMSYNYVKMYPQQLGLTFFESIFLRIWNFYGIFQYMNVIFVSLIIFLSGRLSHEIFDDPSADLFSVSLTFSFLPLFYYTSYIYGDVFALFSCFFIALMLIKYSKSGKILYPILGIIMSCIMLPIRENSLIFLLTTAIFLIIMAIKNKKASFLIIAFLIIILPLLSTKGIRRFYEIKSGVTLDNEVPAINWIVMGMRGNLEDNKGVGYYDGYNYYSWSLLGQDKEASIAHSKEEMRKYFEEYRKDPYHAYRFYRYKVFEQWLEPTFDCIYMTVADHPEKLEKYDLYKRNNILKLNSIMNYMLTVAYACAFICAVFILIKDKEYYHIIPAVFFIGVFLFSIIWEAKGRYTMPAFVTLLLLSAGGLSYVHSMMDIVIGKIFKKEK